MPRKKDEFPSFTSFRSGLELRKACNSGAKFVMRSTGEVWEFLEEVSETVGRFKNSEGDIFIFGYSKLARA